MRILAIETSCDETAVALLSFTEEGGKMRCRVLGERISSQAAKHAPYGGVYPNLAKREHQRNLPVLVKSLLEELRLIVDDPSVSCTKSMAALCEKNGVLFASIRDLFEKKSARGIDRIAVTRGPGLAPALWVGVNAAKMFSLLWDIPVIPTNHMEGHVAAALLDDSMRLISPPYPLLALLVSGGHTDLVIAEEENAYRRIGGTVDDAAGEAFDKAARLLGLHYPGGPEIAKLADEARKRSLTSPTSLPRPMLNDATHNVSFSGLKTAVRRAVERKPFSDDERAALAREFEDAVVETLVTKTRRALEHFRPATVVLGGGVAANRCLRAAMKSMVGEYPGVAHFRPTAERATDNAVMIALAAYRRRTRAGDVAGLSAEPNLPLDAPCTTSG